MGEEKKGLKPLIGSKGFLFIVVSMVSNRILQGVLGIWLSSTLSRSLAFFVVCAPFAIYLIVHRKRSPLQGIRYLMVVTTYVLICALGAIGLYYVPERRLPIWVTFVVFGLLIVSLVWTHARRKARPAIES